jgi:chemotaxis protein MotB
VPQSSPSHTATDFTAFKPVVPSQFRTQESKEIKSVKEVKELPQSASVPFAKAENNESQEKIDALNRRIAELETNLAAIQKQVEQKPAELALVGNVAAQKVSQTVKKPVSDTKLPSINKPGITVSSDESGKIHIEIIDQVLFMPKTGQLTAEAETTLQSVAAEIRAFDANAMLDIEGHTDSLIGDPKNMTQKHDQSSIKSVAVMEYFINTLRWDAAKIRTSSYGRSRPVADNGTPEGRARNNRIEIVFQPKS